MKASLKHLLPAPTRRWLRRAFGWRWFRGRYATWAEAARAAAGYDDAAILARVLSAARDVKAGRAAWERDGTTFARPEVNGPLLSVLREIAAAEGSRLDVIDFGGGLGSTWSQHREALAGVARVRWRVVEQPHYVAAAHEFADGSLSFHTSLASALATGPASVILLSSVLPYIAQPYGLLAEVNGAGLEHVIIDRTPFLAAGPGRLVVQHTPPELGGGSYPCWLFDRSAVIAALGPDYELKTEWPGADVIDPQVEYRGLYLRRLNPARAS